jgi:hypothetical protein
LAYILLPKRVFPLPRPHAASDATDRRKYPIATIYGGNDLYRHGNQGIPLIQDSGGTSDVVQIANATYQTINLYRDGSIDTPVVVENHFLNSTSHVEWVVDQNGQGWQL